MGSQKLVVKKLPYSFGSYKLIITSPVKTIFGSFHNQKSGFFFNSVVTCEMWGKLELANLPLTLFYNYSPFYLY